MDTHRIESYLNNELPEAEKVAFEKEIASSADLNAEVAMHRQIRSFVGTQEANRLKGQVKDWLQTEAMEEKEEAKVVAFQPRRTAWFYLSRVAAVLVVIVGIALIYRSFQSKTLAASSEIAVLATEDPGTYQGNEITDWQTPFRQKNYPKVIGLLKEKPEKSPEEWYGLGVAFLNAANPDYQQAMVCFTQPTLQDHALREKATWALSLAYTQSHRQAEAQQLWQKINKEGGFYAEKAGEMLGE